MRLSRLAFATSLSIAATFPAALPAKTVEPFRFEVGDRVALVGGALAERMQHHGHLEARLQVLLPAHVLSFRNLGFSADALTVQQRTAGFGTQDDYLGRAGANVVFGFWGFNESFGGEPERAQYAADLRAWIEHVRGAGRRVVLFSCVPFEDRADPLLPDPAIENARLSAYDATTGEVAAALGVPFVDVSTPLKARYAAGGGRYTINGVHLNDAGNALLAEVVADAVVGAHPTPDADRLEATRAAVRAKNLLWFNRYRATDGYNVYGGRSSLAYVEGQTNFTVLQRELEILDAMCDDRDALIRAIARGDAPPAVDTDLPAPIPVRTNKPGRGAGGEHTYLTAEEAIARMTPAPGMEISLFADETMFPELVNPVQMAWDTRGRLWVATWPTYPHWTPGRPMNDRLVILEDEDGDGRADTCKTFAGDLHNPTGFEFWDGGVLVANAPDLLFLRDTDGDDVADERERLLGGLSSADTHHSANSFVVGPDGALYFQEGTFHQSQVETIHGPVRNRNGCVWRFEPRTWRVERYVPYNFANPHGHVFDRWGQDFVTDGTGNVNYYALPFSGHLDAPKKHGGYFPFFRQRSRPCAGTEILSSRHFPVENQGNYLIANVIGFQGIFQYEVKDDGSGFRAEEVDPIVHSADPNFRPADLEVGPDGALYFLDWHNTIIGHMQHHLRDPSRDRSHGRVYRVKMAGEPLLVKAPIADLEIRELLPLLTDSDDRVRYRTRLELSGRETALVVKEIREWALMLAANAPDADHHRLEALWVQQMHGVLDEGLVVRLLASRDPRARAAATRALRQMRRFATRPLERLVVRTDDPHPRVRLEALVALSFFRDPRAAEAALKVLDHPMDRFLDYALGETLKQLEPWWRDALTSGRPFAADRGAGVARLLMQLTDDELRRVAESEALFRELLTRHGLEKEERRRALLGLARLAGTDPATELLGAIVRADQEESAHADHLVMGLFGAMPALSVESRATLAAPLAGLAVDGRRASTRRLATAARMRADGSVRPAWDATAGSVERRIDLLDAAPFLRDERLAAELFPRTLALLDAEGAGDQGTATRGRYVRIELPGRARILTLAEVEVWQGGRNIAPSGRSSQESEAWGAAAARATDGNKSGRFGDGGQTHTAETRKDPWWELDLGSEQPIDAVTVWNRTDGDLGRRLDGFVLTVLDDARRTVFETSAAEAPAVSAAYELVDPVLRLRRRAALALGALGVRSDETVEVLVARFPQDDLRDAVVRALREIPADRWPTTAATTLAGHLTETLDAASKETIQSPAGRELLAFADDLAPHLDDASRARLVEVRRRVGPQVIVLRPVRDSLLYDRAEFTVIAGRPVEVVFDNTDLMPHNFVVTAPGQLAAVGLAAEDMASDPGATAKGFIPDLAAVLHATRLLQPGDSQTLRFDAPEDPDDYPYVCTFPGHWVRMNGVMHVVAATDDAALATSDLRAPVLPGTPAARPFVAAWEVADLAKDLARVPSRDPARGLEVMKAASCLACHEAGADIGTNVGPDLREVVGKYDRAALLEQILAPSSSIAEEYATEIFVTYDGKVVAGRVLEDAGRTIKVQTDPYQKKPPVELPRRSVRIRRASDVSGMPQGLLSTFQRGDILDLLAYLESLKSGDG